MGNPVKASEMTVFIFFKYAQKLKINRHGFYVTITTKAFNHFLYNIFLKAKYANSPTLFSWAVASLSRFSYNQSAKYPQVCQLNQAAEHTTENLS